MKMFYYIMLVIGLGIFISCEGEISCALCGREHQTEEHMAKAKEIGGISNPKTMASEELLIQFIEHRRESGFTLVNSTPYRSDLNGALINVYVSDFGLEEYLETSPTQSFSKGMIPRGAFVVREIENQNGEIASLTALYRGPRGYNSRSGDFWFAVTDADGNIKSTKGERQVGPLESCSSCHASRSNADYLFGVPKEHRFLSFDRDSSEKSEDKEIEKKTPESTLEDNVEEGTQKSEPKKESVSLELEIANLESSLSRPQKTTISVNAEIGSNIVIAREATQAEFEAFWGRLPEKVIFVNQGGTGSFGAPIVNGGESWVLKVGGEIVDGPTLIGQKKFAYSRRSADLLDWEESDQSQARPGFSNAELGPGIWLTQWSDADEYAFEFLEISVR